MKSDRPLSQAAGRSIAPSISPSLLTVVFGSILVGQETIVRTVDAFDKPTPAVVVHSEMAKEAPGTVLRSRKELLEKPPGGVACVVGQSG